MELLDFLNEHENWEEILSNAPYYLIVKHDGPYVLLEYQQFASDMTNILCQQARGAIFRQNYEGKWIAVSIGMYKFFNYGQPEAAEIDWSSAVVSTKVDGSNIRLAYDHVARKWLVSTTGTIRASNAQLGSNRTFYSEFVRLLGGEDKFAAFCNSLFKQYTYYFEMVSYFNKIVVRYGEEAIYYIGRRDMITFNERPMADMPLVMKEYGIRAIPTYFLSSLSECIDAAEALGENNEGFVVTDSHFNRLKVKTPWYVAMHHIRGNGVLTVRRVIELWTADLLDDFVGNFPEYQEFVKSVMDKVVDIIEKHDESYNMAMKMCDGLPRKEAAQKINEVFTSRDAAYIFARMNGKVQNAAMYVFNNAKHSYRKFGDYIAAQLDITEFGVEEEV
jgi:hypothetical protein